MRRFAVVTVVLALLLASAAVTWVAFVHAHRGTLPLCEVTTPVDVDALTC